MMSKKMYGVFFTHHGYAEIEAESAEEAMKLADETIPFDEVTWDDDWSCTDAQPVEDIWL